MTNTQMNTNTRMSKVFYPELSYILNGFLYKIHNNLGRFCRERQYGDALEAELKNIGIIYQREVAVPLIYENQDLGGNQADFLVDGKILIELKAKQFTTADDFAQVLRYLKASNLKLGLLVNFRNRYLRIRRIAN